jgi:hypothetical protein
MFLDNYSSCWDFDLDECVSIWGLCFWRKFFYLLGSLLSEFGSIWGSSFWQELLFGIWFWVSEI